ncbi:hypothetical protein H6P81_013459 [Aristolochia fimbriata]|uniref:RRM domain-containing protein n=1 Tax=Aristolochia fimbriata TaxID=158543 RepID=A0AAV7EHY6_ARIFI|nr:hypothetical protein H6P81_013459 [Aristolochia fimbriata]
MDLMIQVLGLAPETNRLDLINFFSYCGSIISIDDIQFQKYGEDSQLAFITFRQPYAQKTAVLLDGAKILGHHVRIVPFKYRVLKTLSIEDENETLNRTKELHEMRCPEKGKELASVAVKQAVGNVKHAIALYLSHLLGRQNHKFRFTGSDD